MEEDGVAAALAEINGNLLAKLRAIVNAELATRAATLDEQERALKVRETALKKQELELAGLASREKALLAREEALKRRELALARDEKIRIPNVNRPAPAFVGVRRPLFGDNPLGATGGTGGGPSLFDDLPDVTVDDDTKLAPHGSQSRSVPDENIQQWLLSEGPWMCPFCSEYNAAKRLKCNNCNQPFDGSSLLAAADGAREISKTHSFSPTELAPSARSVSFGSSDNSSHYMATAPNKCEPLPQSTAAAPSSITPAKEVHDSEGQSSGLFGPPVVSASSKTSTASRLAKAATESATQGHGLLDLPTFAGSSSNSAFAVSSTIKLASEPTRSGLFGPRAASSSSTASSASSTDKAAKQSALQKSSLFGSPAPTPLWDGTDSAAGSTAKVVPELASQNPSLFGAPASSNSTAFALGNAAKAELASQETSLFGAPAASSNSTAFAASSAAKSIPESAPPKSSFFGPPATSSHSTGAAANSVSKSASEPAAPRNSLFGPSAASSQNSISVLSSVAKAASEPPPQKHSLFGSPASSSNTTSAASSVVQASPEFPQKSSLCGSPAASPNNTVFAASSVAKAAPESASQRPSLFGTAAASQSSKVSPDAALPKGPMQFLSESGSLLQVGSCRAQDSTTQEVVVPAGTASSIKGVFEAKAAQASQASKPERRTSWRSVENELQLPNEQSTAPFRAHDAPFKRGTKTVGLGQPRERRSLQDLLKDDELRQNG
eukprot:TRINITY_DN12584_c0_g1_i1.p1 TRINITY_DN12584_c0_g1~~TRINITY_DN12584_c0_g1_i1.p1  ORF type:complete len:743 (+),score=135.52 TRINITY_DN12584_c0_g1_i1:59-2230(+)